MPFIYTVFGKADTPTKIEKGAWQSPSPQSNSRTSGSRIHSNAVFPTLPLAIYSISLERLNFGALMRNLSFKLLKVSLGRAFVKVSAS